MCLLSRSLNTTLCAPHSLKVELKSVCFYSLPKRDFKRRNREEKKQRERAETEVVTKRID